MGEEVSTIAATAASGSVINENVVTESEEDASTKEVLGDKHQLIQEWHERRSGKGKLLDHSIDLLDCLPPKSNEQKCISALLCTSMLREWLSKYFSQRQIKRGKRDFIHAMKTFEGIIPKKNFSRQKKSVAFLRKIVGFILDPRRISPISWGENKKEMIVVKQ